MNTEDFIALCKKGEWEIASVYVNELWEKGEDVKAEALRRLFLQCQADFEPLMEFVPYEEQTPPVLEKCWYEGDDKKVDVDQMFSETAENAEAVYQAHRAQVNAQI